MARSRASTSVLAAAVALGACTIFHPLDGISDGVAPPADAASDAPIDASVDAIPTGDAARTDAPPPSHCTNGVVDADETGKDCGGPTCARCRFDGACLTDDDCTTRHCTQDPTGGLSHCRCQGDMAPADLPDGSGKTCVDRVEVSRDDYNAFSDACQNGQCAQLRPTACVFKDSFAPATDGTCPPADTTTGNLPINCVDWCDAYVYCAWRGKRLCGAFGAGATPFSAFVDPAKSEWFNACSMGKKYDYPYGAQTSNAWDPARCNGQDVNGQPAGGPVQVGSTNCQGAFPDLVDLSGNVWEWESSCNAETGSGDLCRARGGAWDSDQNALKCGSDHTLARGAADPTVGFRCCGG